jgi:hypothetical protein
MKDMNLIIMSFCPTIFYFLALRFKYFPQLPVLKHPQSVLLPKRERPSSTLIRKTTGKMFLIAGGKIKFVIFKREVFLEFNLSVIWLLYTGTKPIIFIFILFIYLFAYVFTGLNTCSASKQGI